MTPLGDLCNGWEAYFKCYGLWRGLLPTSFSLKYRHANIFFLSWWEKDKWLNCIFSTHPITLIPFPAQHWVFLGQECDFIVLTTRSLLIANADFLLVAPLLCIVVRCTLYLVLVKNCLQLIQACFNGQVHSDRRTQISGLMQTLWLERDLEFGLCIAGTLQHNVVLVQMPSLVSSLNTDL